MRTTLDPTLDVVFKMLFGSRASRGALVDLLTAVLRPPRPITDVRVLNPEVGREQVEDKGIVLDLLVEFDDGTRVDVEMQVARRAGLRRRAVYYWARLFSGQLERGQPYTALRPVISVLFLDYIELDTPRFHSTFRIMEAHDHLVFSNVLELHVIELPKRARAARQDERPLLDWSRFLGAKTDEEVKEACMSNPAIAKANELRKDLAASPTVQELVRQRQLALDTYRIEMSAAKDEGREEGKEEGRQMGQVEGLRFGIQALLEVLGIELDQARKTELAQLSADELVALGDRLRRERRW